MTNTQNASNIGAAPATPWRGGFAFAMALHATAVAAILFWPHKPASPDIAAAINIELAPIVSAPPEPLTEAPPGPEVEEEPEVIEEPEPLPPPPPKPIIRKVEVPQPPKPEVRKVREMTAPPVVRAPEAKVAAAPVNAQPSLAERQAIPTYEQLILAHLERHKKYPRHARRRMQEGTAYVRIKIDRNGQLLMSRLERSSGHALLDEEVQIMAKRAIPYPPIPDDITSATFERVVPVRFYMR